jgi:hypothetical protein
MPSTTSLGVKWGTANISGTARTAQGADNHEEGSDGPCRCYLALQAKTRRVSPTYSRTHADNQAKAGKAASFLTQIVILEAMRHQDRT